MQYASIATAEAGVVAQEFPYDDDGGGGGGGGVITQLVAYETGFAALTARGDVVTWGDERYAACLGREVTDARYVRALPSFCLSLCMYMYIYVWSPAVLKRS